MKYLLDTNTCIGILANQPAPLVAQWRSKRASQLRLCSVVKGELLVGAEKSVKRDRVLQALQVFFARFRSMPFDDRAAEVYGSIRAALEVAGTPIGPNDLLIASIALANGLTLVTHNTAEFGRIPGLHVEDWETLRSQPALPGGNDVEKPARKAGFSRFVAPSRTVGLGLADQALPSLPTWASAAGCFPLTTAASFQGPRTKPRTKTKPATGAGLAACGAGGGYAGARVVPRASARSVRADGRGSGYTSPPWRSCTIWPSGATWRGFVGCSTTARRSTSRGCSTRARCTWRPPRGTSSW